MGMRAAYQEKMDAQLNAWQARIQQYAADPALSVAGGLPERQRMVERLQSCYRAARARLDALRSSQDERWDSAKQALERAMIDLKKALDESGAGYASRTVHLQAGGRYVGEPYFRGRR